MKHFLKEYLSYTRAERNGIFILTALILLLSGYLAFRKYTSPPARTSHTADLIEPPPTALPSSSVAPAIDTRSVWHKHFSKRTAVPEYTHERKQSSYTPNKFLRLEINTADSASFEKLRGIGPVLAARIVRYREKLGGFIAVSQIAEVYGIDSVLYAELTPHLFSGQLPVKKININNASFDDLRQHPYVRYKIAELIVAYRTQHNAYTQLSDLRKIILINDELYCKLTPYLTTE